MSASDSEQETSKSLGCNGKATCQATTHIAECLSLADDTAPEKEPSIAELLEQIGVLQAVSALTDTPLIAGVQGRRDDQAQHMPSDEVYVNIEPDDLAPFAVPIAELETSIKKSVLRFQDERQEVARELQHIKERAGYLDASLLRIEQMRDAHAMLVAAQEVALGKRKPEDVFGKAVVVSPKPERQKVKIDPPSKAPKSPTIPNRGGLEIPENLKDEVVATLDINGQVWNDMDTKEQTDYLVDIRRHLANRVESSVACLALCDYPVGIHSSGCRQNRAKVLKQYLVKMGFCQFGCGLSGPCDEPRGCQ